jgi:hypothetical protein
MQTLKEFVHLGHRVSVLDGVMVQCAIVIVDAHVESPLLSSLECTGAPHGDSRRDRVSLGL